MRRGLRAFVVGGAAAVALIAGPGARSASAQQVTGLTVQQRDGYATLGWQPIAGATEYEIERTPVDAADVPTGPAAIRGLWRPNRQIHQESPTFADAGFAPGDRFRWRVRARLGGEPQPYSEPVFGTTLAPVGPQEFLTPFETSPTAQFTSYEAEIEWTRRLDAASERVRVVTIGHTALGREINLFLIGYPRPPASAAEASRAPTSGANCNVHGNEPSGREGCFMMIRRLAFSNEPWVLDILSHATVLIVPAINGDGRAANTRGNSTGQDLNRDHGRLTQPETLAFARFLRDYTPEVMVDGHEFGNTGTCDLPLLWPRHSNTAPSVHNEGKLGLVEGWFYSAGAMDGWWPCPYPVPGIDGAQTFTRVTGLKNMIVTLVEARSSAGASRPGEGNGAENRRRKAYSHAWTIREALEYHRTNLPAVQRAIADGIAFQRQNIGPVVFHGDWDVEPFPAPHPGDSPPPNNPPGPEQMLDPPPCAYRLTQAQYTTPLDDSGSLPAALRTSAAQRLDAHGIAVQARPDGYLVRMAQPLRGLINIVLDGQTPPAPIVAAERIYECPHAEVTPERLTAAVAEGARQTVPLTIANIAVEPDQELDWTITEAEDDCDSPSDLTWVSAGAASGSTPSSSSTRVNVTFDAAGLVAPEARSGLLCLTSNDPGDAVIEVPLRLQVRYPFAGLEGRTAAAGSTIPLRFTLGGDRGLSILASGSPSSRRIDCQTRQPLGAATPAETPGASRLDYRGGAYRFNWKTAKAWAGTCRELTLALDDGSEHVASFTFR
jgi:hypothetical protein